MDYRHEILRMDTMQVHLYFYVRIKIYYGALHLDIKLLYFAIHIIGALHLIINRYHKY